MLTVATSRYFSRQKVIESGLCPLGCTTGAPKYPLGYELAGNIGLLAPFGLRDVEDRAEFESAYRARLDSFGVVKIQRLLEAFAKATESPGVVLLCYEDLA